MTINIIANLDELAHMTTKDPIFADIETDGLYLETRLIQLYQPATHKKFVYIIDTDIISLEKAKVWLKNKHTVWHGCTYDFGTLQMTTETFDDTMYLARTAYPEWQRFTLDNVIDRLGLNLYEDLDKKALQRAGFKKGAVLTQEQYRYAATDVWALAKIWEDRRIQATRNVLAYKVDILSVGYSIEYQKNGLLVSQQDVIRELANIAGVISDNEEALQGLNPNSPKQVKEFLGSEDSSKETLVKLIAKGNKTAELVYNQRRLLKRRTMLESYNFPKVETRFNPAGAATGRFTSTGGDLQRGINAQQITRDLQYIFNKDTEDTSVVHADYSTAELRAGCAIMREPMMYQELKEGKDLHKIAATLALGGDPEDVTKAERQKGKAISFGFIFGMSAPSFVEYAYVNYGVKFSLNEAKAIKNNYTKRYRAIAQYHKEKWDNYETVPVETPLGRKNKARLGTDAINYATQGCIAETTKLAIHYLCKEHPSAISYIYNVVHDAVYLRVPKGREKIWADRLVKAMKKGWSEMCKRPMIFYKDIPMPVEVEYLDVVEEL